MAFDASTHWTLLLHPEKRAEAFEHFYENYKGAVIALFRQRGIASSDAEDLAQEFFLTALKRNFLEKADPERGRFRGYLCTAAKRFIISHQRKTSRRNRINRDTAGMKRRRPPRTSGPSPEAAFDRAWARSLLDRAKLQTLIDLTDKGKEHYFDAFAMRSRGDPWKDVARRCGTSPAAVQGWVRYVKQAYTGALRYHIAGTVSGPGAVESELKELWSLLHPDETPAR